MQPLPKQLLLENILQSYSNLKKSHMWAVIMNSSQSVSSCLRAFEEISGRFVISFCSCCGPSPVGRRTICNKNSFYAWEHMGIDVAFFSSFSPHAELMAKCPILSACHDAFLYFKATKTVKAFGIGSAAEQWPPEPFFKALSTSQQVKIPICLSVIHIHSTDFITRFSHWPYLCSRVSAIFMDFQSDKKDAIFMSVFLKWVVFFTCISRVILTAENDSIFIS